MCPVVRGEWTRCPADVITWLDRGLLSGNEDLTLHRSPRCAGLRYVHHRWELFSRDTTYRVYLAPDEAAGDGPVPAAGAVRKAASQVLPMAPAHYEALPVVLEEGSWLVSVAQWVVRLRLEFAAEPAAVPPGAPTDTQPVTQDGRVLAGRPRSGGQPGEDAVARVRAWFDRNGTARLAMAFYYQEYIL